jgi:hypothetical protein
MEQCKEAVSSADDVAAAAPLLLMKYHHATFVDSVHVSGQYVCSSE